jgi:hypothetical protein
LIQHLHGDRSFKTDDEKKGLNLTVSSVDRKKAHEQYYYYKSIVTCVQYRSLFYGKKL